MSIARQLIDDHKLKIAAQKIYEGIAEMQNLGLEKEMVLEGFKRQLDAFYDKRQQEA